MMRPLALLLALLLALWPLAARALQPPTSYTIKDVLAVPDVLTSGDLLVLVHFQVDQANPGSTTLADAWVVEVRYGGQTLGAVVPYTSPFAAGGWGPAAAGLYLPPGHGVPTGGALEVRLVPNPTHYDDLAPVGRTLTGADWGQGSDDIAAWVLYVSQDLGQAWGVELTSSTGVGTVLSSYGLAYWPNAVPGLINYAPQLFAARERAPSFDTATKTPAIVGGQGAPGWWQQALYVAGKNFPKGWILPLIGLGMVIAVLVLAYGVAGDVKPALLAVPGTLVVEAFLGLLPPVLVYLAIFALTLAAGWLLFGRTA